ncbi:hypothetical protein [Streptomyces sp. A30]|uniref:hypothetical protein n=1 Tax=Streptomyces sp. A30 TaxID=2789273 RepID=UPI0039807CBA
MRTITVRCAPHPGPVHIERAGNRTSVRTAQWCGAHPGAQWCGAPVRGWMHSILPVDVVHSH